MKKVTRFFSRTASLLLVAASAAATSCTLHGAHQEGIAHHEPQFRVRAVEEASLNGLDVLALHEPADMDLPRRNQVIAGYVNQQLPLRIRVRVNAYNPNPVPTAIAGFDYTVLVDGRPLGKSRLVNTLELPAGDSVRVPLTFEFNTYKYLGEDAMPALRNFALGFGDLRRQRITLQVRPLLRAPKGRFSSPVSQAALAYGGAATTQVSPPPAVIHAAPTN